MVIIIAVRNYNDHMMPQHSRDGEAELVSLIDFIMAARPAEPVEWQGWEIGPVPGGRNNLLYRALREGRDLAVKITRRDARDRAGREYHGLALMAAHAPGLAPIPYLFDRDRWTQPVVVQAWLDGAAVEKIDDPDGWSHLAGHYAALHRITPDRVEPALRAPLRPAVLNFCTAREGVEYVLDDLDRLPEEARPPGLGELAVLLAQVSFPEWPTSPRVFGRCDPNLANFLQVGPARPWASVDWENSGWLDPAFELGDLMTHPCYRSAAPADWQQYLACCASLYPYDRHLITRMLSYRAILLVRWAVVFARFWYQRDHSRAGHDRLVEWPDAWWQSLPFEFERYRQMAEQALSFVGPF